LRGKIEMKKGIQKIIIIGLLICCMFASLTLPASAAGDSGTVLNDGVISVLVDSISAYRTEQDSQTGYFITYPSREGYLFAGWYEDARCTKAYTKDTIAGVTEAYAKFVPEEVLSVKAQVTAGTAYDSTKADLRLITTVDSLSYQKVGFDVRFGKNTYNAETDTVYYQLYAIGSSSSVLKMYTPEVFDIASECFMAVVVRNIPTKAFGRGAEATPYWVTLDGTKVQGVSAIKTVSMSYLPSVATMSTKQVGEIAFPSTGWSTASTPDLATQGGCTDGTYYYQAVKNEATATTEPKRQEEFENIIQRYKWSSADSKWVEDSQSEALHLHHANDLTYNKNLSFTKSGQRKTGLLVISYCGDIGTLGDGKRYVGFMDPTDLKMVAPKDVELDLSAYGVTDNYTEEYVDIGKNIINIEYNARRDQYVVGMSGVYDVCVLDSTFQQVGKTHEAAYEQEKYTAQGIGADDAYIYFVYSAGTGDENKDNKLAVYDWDGNFVNMITLDIEWTNEIENISIYNRNIYIAANNSDRTKTNVYQVTGAGDFQSICSENADLFGLNRTASRDTYVETTIEISGVTSDSQPRFAGLRLTNEADVSVDYVVGLSTGTGTPSVESLSVTSSDGSYSQDFTSSLTDDMKTAATTGSGLKLGIAKVNDILYVFVNDEYIGTANCNGFGEVKTYLYSEYTTTTFSNYSAGTPDKSIGLVQNVGDTRNATSTYYISEEGVPSAKVAITGETTKHGYMYFGGTGTVMRAETYIDITDVSGAARAGITLKDKNGKQININLYAPKSATRLQALEYQPSTNGVKDESWGEALKQIEIPYTNVKLGVYRDGDSIKVYVNDELMYQDTLTSCRGDFDVTGAVSVGLNVYSKSATFYDFTCTHEDTSVGFIENAASARNVTPHYVSENGRLSAKVAITGKTDEHGYMYFGGTGTVMHAETYIDITDVSGNARAGITLKDKNGKQININLYAPKSATRLQALEYQPSTNGAKDTSWGKVLKQFVSTDTVTVEDEIEIPYTNVKLGVYRDGDSIKVYVNDELMYQDTLTSFREDFDVTGAVSVGLNVYNQSATFYDFTYMYWADAEDSVQLVQDASATKNTTLEYISEDGELGAVVSITGTYSEHGYLYFAGTGTSMYTETYVDLTNTESDGRAGITLKDKNGRQFNVNLKASGTADVSALEWQPSINGAKDGWGKVLKELSDIGRTNIKLGVWRNGDRVKVYVNGEVMYDGKISDYDENFDTAGTVSVGLNVWHKSATFRDFTYVYGNDVKESVAFVKNTSATRNATPEYVSDSGVLSAKVAITGKTDEHGYMYFGGTDTVMYAETYIDITDVSGDARAGITLKDKNGKQININLYAPANATRLQALQYQPSTNGAKDTSWGKALKQIEIPYTNVKLGVYRDSDSIKVYVNDELMYQDTLTSCRGDFDVTGAVSVGLNVYSKSATFYDFTYSCGSAAVDPGITVTGE